VHAELCKQQGSTCVTKEAVKIIVECSGRTVGEHDGGAICCTKQLQMIQSMISEGDVLHVYVAVL
jgi:hypothetical protein